MACQSCTLRDEQNFRYQADLEVEVLPVPAGVDLRVDWSALQVDLQGHPIDPQGGIAEAHVVVFPELRPDEVALRLTTEGVLATDIQLYMSCAPVGTGCDLSAFSLFGSTLDVGEVFVPGSGSWLVLVEPASGVGAAGLLFLSPEEGVAPTLASVRSDSATLEVEVDLGSLEPLVLPAGSRAPVLDWSALRTNGLGQALEPEYIDRLQIARFDLGVEELEQQVFDLEGLATGWWELDVEGSTQVSLDALPEDFLGIDADGTWLLALSCSSCEVPAPRFVTVLQVGELPS